MDSVFNVLDGYQPKKIDDGFDIIKDRSLKCEVESARFEEYTGDRSELQGVRFFSYALIIVEHQKYTGRKLWKRFNLSDESQIKKLADVMFTLGMEFKTEEELQVCADQFAKMTLSVRAWGWKRDGEQEELQMHAIKGEYRENQEQEVKAPF